jgi:hypothetical protein
MRGACLQRNLPRVCDAAGFLLVAHLRYNRGDRTLQFVGSPPALSPSQTGLLRTTTDKAADLNVNGRLPRATTLAD